MCQLHMLLKGEEETSGGWTGNASREQRRLQRRVTSVHWGTFQGLEYSRIIFGAVVS